MFLNYLNHFVTNGPLVARSVGQINKHTLTQTAFHASTEADGGLGSLDQLRLVQHQGEI